ncbi:hypothetical protein BUALT_Bualt14G0096500 [Buddleja alternifolia]|uniref:Uncharacterized protein n=1 Tax=Buddleja alternifolia TaxID=168488 RepID=A0AAV6WGI4_9LAMI|nr:hypothetical protein BUALT_Bualt14G0096500 [Buddleja alternifolia]
MNYNTDNDMWDWQGEDYCLEDNTSIEMSKCMLNGVNQNEEHLSYVFDDEATPVKACGDLAYRVTNSDVRGKELEPYKESSPQVKRRRVLQFESEVLDAPLCNDEMFLRSKETPDSLEDAVSEMSQWVAGFAEGTSASGNECLDPSSEGWIADCFNDTEMLFSTEDIASGASDIQVDITELCNTPPEYDPNAVEKRPVHTLEMLFSKVIDCFSSFSFVNCDACKKSYMRSPPKLASSVIYPFTFIKPCGAHGDVTLKDINQKIHTPPKSKQDDQILVFLTKSAFSGKPVVGKTKIRTEGGEGSITIVRTKG